MSRYEHQAVPVKNPRFFQHISQVNIGVQKVRVKLYRLFKMMYGKPNLSLGVEDTSQITPRNGKSRGGLDSFQIALLK